MVNFVGVPAVNPGVTTPLFGGQPVRIWTPGVPLQSPRSQGNRAGGRRGGEEEGATLTTPPPPSRITLPGCAPIDSCPTNAWTAEAMNSGLSSPMARNVNAIMAAVNGTKNKRRVTFLNESAPSGKISRSTASAATQQKGVQDRKIERRPARNPYRKAETQTRRKMFGAGTPTPMLASQKPGVWNFPTRIEEFKKPEIEDIFNDFWKSVDEEVMEKYFKDFWRSVQNSNDKMESHFLDFWKGVRQSQDSAVDLADFWRHVEGKNRKRSPKENLAANFWRMIEGQKKTADLDEAAIAGHFLRMAQKSESEARESRPWETPARDMWKLIQHEEKCFAENSIPPEALIGDFFRMADKKQASAMPAANDAELMTGQFWKMVHKQTNAGREVKFVADEAGNVFRNIKGHQMKDRRSESMIEARLANEFFTMIENQKDQKEEVITFVADSYGNIYEGFTAKKMKSGKPLCEAKMVNDFFTMIEKKRKHDDARVESFAGNFWKMINNSEGRLEGKGKEALAGEFWKTVEFIENLKKKRETMRRLSESRREEAEYSVASIFTAATIKKSPSDDKEAARKAAMLYAISSLEQQQYKQYAFVNEKPVGRQRTLSSSSSSLYSVREEEEEELKNSRRTYKAAPHYNALQLGPTTNNGNGIILVALRHKNKTAKPQQCHKQNMVAQERRGSITRRNRIPSISNGSNNDRKCGKRAW